jgi:hypothetical protein
VAVNGMTRACSLVEWLIPLVCLSVTVPRVTQYTLADVGVIDTVLYRLSPLEVDSSLLFIFKFYSP